MAVFLVMLVSLTSCTSRQENRAVTNTDLINFRDFSLNAGPVNQTTMARGTVFVRGDLDKPEDITIQIAMIVEIDPADWGGVNLYFPEGWEITQIASGFPVIDGQQESIASVWTNGQPVDGGRSWVEIGRRDVGSGPFAGIREATLIIDAGYVLEGASTPAVLDLIVAVGSKGVTLGPVSVELEIPLLSDYRSS